MTLKRRSLPGFEPEFSTHHLTTFRLRLFADQRLTRKTPASYADGVYMMAGQDRPSPRKLSQIFMKGKDGLPSSKNRTALLVFFGKPGI